MTGIFKEIRSAVISAESAASFPVTRILQILGFRELAYVMIDEDIAYLSPATVYNILKKHDLIAERKVKYRDPVRIG